MAASPLIKYPEQTALFTPCLFGPAARYAAMARYGTVYLTGGRYDKRAKHTHRFEILDTHGRVQLTVPVEKPDHTSGLTWDDITVSRHGEWWRSIPTALESAYGRTPYYEYLCTPFLEILAEPAPGTTVAQLCRRADQAVMSLLAPETHLADLPPGVAAERSEWPDIPAYHQLRADKFGFQSGLSVLDLIFNMGTEAPLLFK